MAITSSNVANERVEPWLTGMHAIMGCVGFVVAILAYARDLEKSGKRGKLIVAMARGVAGAVVGMIVGGVALSYGVQPIAALGLGSGFASAGLEMIGRVSDWLLSQLERILNSAAARILPPQTTQPPPQPKDPPKSQDR